jgi:16S rRNA (adenine1518-N6/adenine1519-N6)-dimethyltransferase
VLEIGPGSGFLTMQLAQTAGRVLAVEVDGILTAVSRRFLEGTDNVEIMNADIFQKDSLNPEVIERLRKLGGCSLAVGNLPYSAATAIVSALARSNLSPRGMVFLLQEEVARRLGASPGSPDYGAVSVIMAAAFDAELLQRIGPNVFWPKPKVSSRLVRLRPAQKVQNLERFAAFVHTLFARPRKTAANSFVEGAARGLSGKPGEPKDVLRRTVAAALQSLGVDPKARPGALNLDQVKALHKKLVPESLK